MNRRNFLTMIGLGAVAGAVGVKAAATETIPAGTPLTELYPDGMWQFVDNTPLFTEGAFPQQYQYYVKVRPSQQHRQRIVGEL